MTDSDVYLVTTGLVLKMFLFTVLQVCEASQLLSQWEKEVTNLRAEYEQLLFFSIPKLLHLYQNLMAAQPNPTDIVHDVGFLFENKPHVQSQLKETVKVHSHTMSGIL